MTSSLIFEVTTIVWQWHPLVLMKWSECQVTIQHSSSEERCTIKLGHLEQMMAKTSHLPKCISMTRQWTLKQKLIEGYSQLQSIVLTTK